MGAAYQKTTNVSGDSPENGLKESFRLVSLLGKKKRC